MAKYKKLIVEEAVPLLNFIYTTSDRISIEESAALNGGIINASETNQLKSFQKVVALSPSIINPAFKVGDLVEINIMSYGKPIQKKGGRQSINETDENYTASIQYRVPIVDINGVEYLKLRYTDIETIVTKYREEEIEEKKIPIIEVSTPTITMDNDLTLILN